jgi:hypothetical protein
MRQSCCLDCNHITPYLDTLICPCCQSANMSSNRFHVVLAHAKRLANERTEGTEEFKQKRFETLQELAKQADIAADRRRRRTVSLREIYGTAAAFEENWRKIHATSN